MWIDCHCHTKYSHDNWLEPRDLLRRAKDQGLDGVVVTEHHSYEASAPVEALAAEFGLLVLRGVEVSTDRGHVLVYGVDDDSWNCWNRDNYLPIDELTARIAALGGICVPAHPYRETGLSSLLDGARSLPGIAALETHNGGNDRETNARALHAAHERGLPGLGGSDCHRSAAVARCATEFSVPVYDMAGFIAAVRAGACRGAYYKGHVSIE